VVVLAVKLILLVTTEVVAAEAGQTKTELLLGVKEEMAVLGIGAVLLALAAAAEVLAKMDWLVVRHHREAEVATEQLTLFQVLP
jgi:hypothetical protein